jgi:NAD(P)-dependent dehydrogenase (short-subunit alcohol dehydrogenase family)
MAIRLAADGWNLLLADIDIDGNRQTAEMVSEFDGTAKAIAFDAGDASAWQALDEQLRSDWRHLDLLVNNAGVAGQGDVGDYPLDDWQWVLGTTLNGAIYGCHTFVPWLKRNPRGAHIINTASFAAFVSAPSMGAYNVAKAGVVALSETLYGELLPHNVGVTVVCPAFFQTQLLARGKFRDDAVLQIAQKYADKARLTADAVAVAAIRGMHRKRLYVVLRNRARWYWRVKRLFPAWFHKAVSRGFYRHVARIEKENDK